MGRHPVDDIFKIIFTVGLESRETAPGVDDVAAKRAAADDFPRPFQQAMTA